MHATAYLKKPDGKPVGPVVAVFGSETYLRQRVVDAVAEQVVGSNPDDEMAVVRFPGKTTDLKVPVCQAFATKMHATQQQNKQNGHPRHPKRPQKLT